MRQPRLRRAQERDGGDGAATAADGGGCERCLRLQRRRTVRIGSIDCLSAQARVLAQLVDGVTIHWKKRDPKWQQREARVRKRISSTLLSLRCSESPRCDAPCHSL